jgi:RimJ/RimL family protein N-acetyltransferase
MPWTTVPREELPRRYAQHYWAERAAFSAEHFNLDFAVRRGGELIGVQGFAGRDYPVVRTVETGSWLVAAVQGQGLGTRMRQAICAFLFDHLGAAEITSAAFLDNPASLAVSRKVGYVPNGRVRLSRQGRLAVNEKLLLTPEAFVRGVPIEVSGVEPLRRYLGLA